MTVGIRGAPRQEFLFLWAGSVSYPRASGQGQGAYDYPALALTDTNLCGALEFARLANGLGIRPITGGELTLTDGSRLTLLAQTRAGYSNISRLFTLANAADRRNPRLDPAYLPHHSEGVVLLTGGRDGPLARLALESRIGEADGLLRKYLDWFGPDSVYVELQQNLLQGDTDRNRRLAGIAKRCRRSSGGHQRRPLPLPGTFPSPGRPRSRQPQRHHRPGPAPSEAQSPSLPEVPGPDEAALQRDARGRLQHSARREAMYLQPQHGPGLHPAGSRRTPGIHGRELSPSGSATRPLRAATAASCPSEWMIASRRSSASSTASTSRVSCCCTGRYPSSPNESWRSGDWWTRRRPWRRGPPGRGRGSSVALLVGYLIGISHVDPLRWDLTLERFISEEMTTLPDIDLDFPRGLRDELIQRVHRHFGPEYAVLTGAITTYKVKGIIQDLGKALGLPREHLSLLSKKLQSHHAGELREEMLRMPDFRDRVDTPGWKRPAGPGPAADGRPQRVEPARGRHGAQQHPHAGDGAHASRSHGRPVHHGLEQGQRGRRRLRQDRPPLPAGAGPARGGPRPHGKKGGEKTRPGPDRPEEPQRLRHDQRGQGQGGLPAPVPRPAEDGPAAPLPQSAGPGLPGGPHPARRGSPGQRRLPVRGAVQARGVSGTTTILWRNAPWSGAAASSSGRSRWCSSSRTWRG